MGFNFRTGMDVIPTGNAASMGDAWFNPMQGATSTATPYDLRGTLSRYDSGGADINGILGQLSQYNTYGLSDEELGAGLSEFGDWHRGRFGGGFTGTSSGANIAQGAIQNALNYRATNQRNAVPSEGAGAVGGATDIINNDAAAAARTAGEAAGVARAGQWDSAFGTINEYLPTSTWGKASDPAADRSMYERMARDAGVDPGRFAEIARGANFNDAQWWGPQARYDYMARGLGLDPSAYVDQAARTREQGAIAELGQTAQARDDGSEGWQLPLGAIVGAFGAQALGLGGFGSGAAATSNAISDAGMLTNALGSGGVGNLGLAGLGAEGAGTLGTGLGGAGDLPLGLDSYMPDYTPDLGGPPGSGGYTIAPPGGPDASWGSNPRPDGGIMDDWNFEDLFNNGGDSGTINIDGGGISGIDVGGTELTPGGPGGGTPNFGGTTSMGGTPSLQLQNFLQSSGFTNLPPGAQTALRSLLGGAGGAGGAGTALSRLIGGNSQDGDLVSLLGTLIGGGVDLYGRSQQADALKAIADRSWAAGQPSRDRFNAGMTPGFDIRTIPGLSSGMDAATDSYLRRLAARGGNPAGQGGAQAETNAYVLGNVGLPAWQNYVNANSNAGGMSSLAADSGATATRAATAQGDIYGSLGRTASELTQPPAFNLRDLQRMFSGSVLA